MVVYQAVELARFIVRDNRFVAQCELPTKEEMVAVHVKNTGRCRELLKPGVTVALSYQGNPTRKTAYDLIAVLVGETWINIDSQVPNQLAYEGLLSGELQLPGLAGPIQSVRREVTFGASRFDLVVETESGAQGIVEVKGMTLVNQRVGAFPDAPTLRGLKHVQELAHWSEKGYQTYVVFIVQTSEVDVATIHREMQPALATAFASGMAQQLQVVAQTCAVGPDTIKLKKAIPFELEHPFIDPNRLEENPC